jgi:hypothetical protein
LGHQEETMQNNLPVLEPQELKTKTQSDINKPTTVMPSELPALPKAPIRSISSLSSDSPVSPVFRTAAPVDMIRQLRADSIFHSPSKKTSAKMTLPPLPYKFGFFPAGRKLTHLSRTKSAANLSTGN